VKGLTDINKDHLIAGYDTTPDEIKLYNQIENLKDQVDDHPYLGTVSGRWLEKIAMSFLDTGNDMLTQYPRDDKHITSAADRKYLRAVIDAVLATIEVANAEQKAGR
jgi:hypothetical protein